MEDWIKLAIPLIAVAVWILSNLANQQKEARKPPRVPPPPKPREPADPLAAGPRTKPEEDNKYREEMDRKREKKPVAKSFPKPRPGKRPDVVPKPARLPTILVPTPPPLPRQEEPPPALPPLAFTSESVAKIAPAPVVTFKARSAAVKSLHDLLSKRDSLTTAFLLKEVLDLPVSKRSRRRL